MIKYGVVENRPGYKPFPKKYWCGGSSLPLKEKMYWELIKGIVISYDINAAYRYKNVLTAMWPTLTYAVEEYND